MKRIIQNILIETGRPISKIRVEMQQLGIEPDQINPVIDDFQSFIIRLFDLTSNQMNLIKEHTSTSGLTVISGYLPESGYQAFLAGTPRQYRTIIAELKSDCFGLPEIAIQLETAINNFGLEQFPPVAIQGQLYHLDSKTYVMGIINLTPDSFSHDGLYHKENYIDLAIEQAQQMITAGVDFLDLGAESSRPGAIMVEPEEEERRLLPVLKELLTTVKVPISIDTYKPKVAEKALNLGATILNDIWGLQSPDDPEHQMARIAAETGVPVVLMHNRSQSNYRFLTKEMVEFLVKSMDIASQAGVNREQIIIDPGIGFGKTYQDNLQILQNLDQLKILGRPILLGTSRKSFIGLTLNLPTNERLEGTITSSILGVVKGANILRVHDVEAIIKAVKISDAINGK